MNWSSQRTVQQEKSSFGVKIKGARKRDSEDNGKGGEISGKEKNPGGGCLLEIKAKKQSG